MNLLDRYKEILKEEDVSAQDMAELLGMSYATYRSSTRPSRKPPKWIRSFIIGYELKKMLKNG